MIKFLKKTTKSLDFFSTSEFLRYKEDNDYKSVSGGVFSLATIILLLAMLLNMSIQTFKKTNITYTLDVSRADDPTLTTIQTFPGESTFMFALAIVGLNLNDPNVRYFDIVMRENVYNTLLYPINSTVIPLQPCTDQHVNITPSILNAYQILGGSIGLCIPKNYSFNLKGKYSSNPFERIQITVSKCNNATDPTRPCAPDATIAYLQQMMGQFTLNFLFTNPLINPSSPEYLSYYLQDKNYVKFTTTLGAVSNGFVEDFIIKTDTSILPFSQYQIQQGIIINDPFTVSSTEIINNTYANLNLMKASSMGYYTRSFYKIDSLFSYLGGLFGTIMAAMVILKSYNDSLFEISLCNSLYKIDYNLSGYHLLKYFWYSLLDKLSIIGIKCKNQIKDGYDFCKEEVQKQLDICFLLRRITFLERAIQMLFNENQFKGLHLQNKITVQEAKRFRQNFDLKEMMKLKFNEQKQKRNLQQSGGNTKNSMVIDIPIRKVSPPAYEQESNYKIMAGKDSVKEPKNIKFQDEISIKNQLDGNEYTSKKMKTRQMKTQLFTIQNMSELENIEEEIEDEELKDYRDKIKALMKESLHGNRISQMIIDQIDKRLMDKLISERNQQKYKTILQSKTLLMKGQYEIEEYQ